MPADNRYFGGNGSALGTVHALPHATFSDFVKNVLAHPVLVNITRAEYQGLDKVKQNAYKRVSYFTPATFATAHRTYDNALPANLICLDIDNSDHAASFVRNPRILAERLHPFAFAAYTTASSTEAAPRLRVVVSAEAIPLERYAEMVRYVGETLLGLPSVTTESRVSVQPMYLPTLFRGDDPVDNHPLIIAVPEGERIVDKGQQASTMVGRSASPSGNTSPDDTTVEDGLQFLKSTVDGVTLEDVEQALSYLDPDCDYMEWVAVAAALRHQFPSGKDSAEAFRVFNEWSAKGKKYTTEEDTQSKWDSFKANPKGRSPITIRSVFKRATDAGWSHGDAVADRCYEAAQAWLGDPDRTATELMSQGLVKITTAPLLSVIQRGALLSVLQRALQRCKVSVSKSELKTALARFERAAAKLAVGATASAPDEELPRWARGICYVAVSNEFFQRHTGRLFNPEVLDKYFGVQLMTPADVEAGRPVVRPSDYLLNVLKCPRVDEYVYDPTQSAEAFIVNGTKRAVNLYIPTYPEPDPAAAAAAGEVFWGHLCNLVLEDSYRELLMDWLAYHVQCPGAKIRWAVLLQGAQGCGKTLLAEAMRAVLGTAHVKAIGAELLFTQFNGWAMGSQLVAVEEVRVVGHNRYDVMNKLKPCISNDFVSINDKHLKAFQTRNVSNYIMFTNHHDSLAVGEGDRRYFVVNSPLQTTRQVRALGGAAYFDKLWNMIRNEAAGLRAWMEQWELSTNFNPHGHAPATKYLSELRKAGSSPLAFAVAEAIGDRDHPLVREDLVSTKALKGLLDTYDLPPYSDQTLAAVLREHSYVQGQRITLDGAKHSIWVKDGTDFPNLEDTVRARLAGKFAEPLDFSALE